MTWADAAAYSQVQDARDRIFNSGASFMEKADSWGRLKEIADAPGPQQRDLTFGGVLKGAIGAALGMGVARGASSVLGLGSRFSDKLETAAMGVGAAMNSGMFKSSSDNSRRIAFRMGFLKAAMDRGLFKTSAIAVAPVMLSPAGILGLPKAVADMATHASQTVGGVAGVALGPDSSDAETTKYNVEESLLQKKLKEALAERHDRLVRAVLAKRRHV